MGFVDEALYHCSHFRLTLYPGQVIFLFRQREQLGLASSHLTRFARHSPQPFLDFVEGGGMADGNVAISSDGAACVGTIPVKTWPLALLDSNNASLLDMSNAMNLNKVDTQSDGQYSTWGGMACFGCHVKAGCGVGQTDSGTSPSLRKTALSASILRSVTYPDKAC